MAGPLETKNVYSDLKTLLERISDVTKEIELTESNLVSKKEQQLNTLQEIRTREEQRLSDSFVLTNQYESLLSKQRLITRELELARDNYSHIKGYVQGIEDKLEDVNKKIAEMAKGTSEFVRGLQKAKDYLDQNANKFSGLVILMGDFLRLNKETELIQLRMSTQGFTNISGQSTPLMNQSLQTYGKQREAQIEAEYTRYSGAMNIASMIAGMVVGAPGGAVGMMLGAGAVTTLTKSIVDMMLAGQKEAQANFMATTERLGIVNQVIGMDRDFRDRMETFYTSRGQMFGGNEMAGGGTVGNMRDKLIQNEARFAGMKGFGAQEIGGLMTQMASSRLYGNMGDEGYMQQANQVSALSRITGASIPEIISIYQDLRMKLATPVDELAARFYQLNKVSLDLSIPLSQVVNDMAQLRQINMRFGYSQEQLMGLYMTMGDEIKKGTVNMQDLGKVLQSISSQGLDKAIGVGALIQSTGREAIMANYVGPNAGAANQFLNTITGMNQEDIGLFLKMVANPTAGKNEFMQGLMEQYGVTQDMLQGFNPELQRIMRATSKSYTGTGQGSAINQYIYEAMQSLQGVPFETDLYKQAQQEKMITGIGTTAGVSPLGKTGVEVDMFKRFQDLEAQSDKQKKKELEMYEKLMEQVDIFGQKVEDLVDNKMDPLQAAFTAFNEIVPKSTDLFMEFTNQQVGAVEKLSQILGETSPNTIKERLWSKGGSFMGSLFGEFSPDKSDRDSMQKYLQDMGIEGARVEKYGGKIGEPLFKSENVIIFTDNQGMERKIYLSTKDQQSQQNMEVLVTKIVNRGK